MTGAKIITGLGEAVEHAEGAEGARLHERPPPSPVREEITAKHAALLQEREVLLVRLKEVDRDLIAYRYAARLLNVELPKEERQSRAPPSTISKLILQCLSANGPQKVKPIIAFVTEEIPDMHPKTVGMTLYRLAKAGHVARDGRIWRIEQ